MVTKELLTQVGQALINELADELKKGNGMIEGVRMYHAKLIDLIEKAEAPAEAESK